MLDTGKIKGTNIELRIVKDKEAVAADFARTIADLVIENNRENRPTRLIMPVGPTGQYKIMIEICKTEAIDLSNLHIFFMDEYVSDDGKNLPDTHPFSFAHFLKHNFYDPIDPKCNLNMAQMHSPDAQSPEAYNEAIEDAGGIDVCFGGIGINGHIGFNEALDYWLSMSNEDFKNLSTRVVNIAVTTRVTNAIFGTGGNMQIVPNLAVTVGMREILASRKIHIYLDWPWQKQVLRNTIFGPVTPMFPASFLQEHSDVIITAAEYVAEEPLLMPE